MTDREEFLEIFRTHITRPGSEKLLDWMASKTDFCSAPASTRFHGACDGGLCAHSLNVYRVLHGTFFTPDEDSEETFAICALLHDLCKANTYVREHHAGPGEVYSYVEKEGKAITSVQDVKEGDLLEICVSDGKITARAEKTSAVSWMEQS